MEDMGVLIYCITNEWDDRISEIIGIDGEHKLYPIGCNDLYAICSEANLQEYSAETMVKKGEDVEWIKEKAILFMNIILKINAIAYIIPMNFLTAVSSKDEVQDMIADHTEQLLLNLEEIKEREEISVKIYCDGRKYREKNMKEEIFNFEKTLTGKPEETAAFLKKKFEKELSVKAQHKIRDMANVLMDQIGNFAVKTKSNQLLPREITGMKVPMIMNCAFLVENGQKDGMTRKVAELISKYEEHGIIIEVSGPWPPYNFCEWPEFDD